VLERVSGLPLRSIEGVHSSSFIIPPPFLPAKFYVRRRIGAPFSSSALFLALLASEIYVIFGTGSPFLALAFVKCFERGAIAISIASDPRRPLLEFFFFLTPALSPGKTHSMENQVPEFSNKIHAPFRLSDATGEVENSSFDNDIIAQLPLPFCVFFSMLDGGESGEAL
jgi:hypothetical protein